MSEISDHHVVLTLSFKLVRFYIYLRNA